MIGNQKQLEEGNTGTVSVKLHKWAIQLLDIIAESREHGTNPNDLLKKCIEFVIETAKITGPVPPEMKTLIDMLRLDAAWHSAFNFGDVTATNDIAQIILVLQQHDGKQPRQGFGLAMINKPFMGEATITYCVDSILERIVDISMKGLYQDLRDIGNALGTQSMRETLATLRRWSTSTTNCATSCRRLATSATSDGRLNGVSAPSKRSTAHPTRWPTVSSASCSTTTTARLPTTRPRNGRVSSATQRMICRHVRTKIQKIKH